MSDRPRLYDGFCCAGGASRGYQDAGFEVWGIDNRPQPRYAGDRFIQADFFEFVAAVMHGEYPMPDVWAASPPCQTYSIATKQSGASHLHPDLIAATRGALQATGRPYVIENVMGSKRVLRGSLLLCGAMFPGLSTYRHRLFESNMLLMSLPHPPHLVKTPRSNVYVEGQFMTVYGHVSPVWRAREALGIDWEMTQSEVVEAIPPAYTRYIGAQLMEALRMEAAS